MSSASENPFADPTDPFIDPGGSSDEQAALKYGKLQQAGALRQEWIANPGSICPIPHSSLTFDDLLDLDIIERLEGLPDEVCNEAVAVGLSQEPEYRYVSIISEAPEGCAGDVWVGRTGLGVLFIEVIFREPESNGPRASQIAKAVYERDFDIAGLRYVFVTDVVNEETKRFAETQLYVGENGLCPRDRESHAWNYGTPEYQALLGTRIGKTVAYLVLCAFERGTRRIGRIVTWYAESVGSYPGELQIRFDIEQAR